MLGRVRHPDEQVVQLYGKETETIASFWAVRKFTEERSGVEGR
jgi:hypothetical protein